MSLVVIHPGPATTIQDLGRPNTRGLGVPLGGVCDRWSAAVANTLVANDFDRAVLEMSLAGGTFEATAPLALGLAGAPMAARLLRDRGSDRVVAIPASLTLSPGDRLVIGGTPTGMRAYLAVRGGWEAPLVLGSRSSEQRLQVGARLEAESGVVSFRWLDRGEYGISPVEVLRVIDGPDAPSSGLDGDVLGTSRRVLPQSDRAGVRLEGVAWDLSADPNRVSTPVAPGAVQVAGGQLLVLGVNCGTMGGYPHVAHVIAADLDRLGQLRPGDWVRFARVDLAEARRLDLERRQREATCLMRLASMVRGCLGG